MSLSGRFNFHNHAPSRIAAFFAATVPCSPRDGGDDLRDQSECRTNQETNSDCPPLRRIIRSMGGCPPEPFRLMSLSSIEDRETALNFLARPTGLASELSFAGHWVRALAVVRTNGATRRGDCINTSQYWQYGCRGASRGARLIYPPRPSRCSSRSIPLVDTRWLLKIRRATSNSSSITGSRRVYRTDKPFFSDVTMP